MISIEKAAEIMGENFISIEEMRTAFPSGRKMNLCDHSQEASLLKGVNFSEETLRKNNCILIPGIRISMFTMSRMFPSPFYGPEWLTEDFGHTEVENRWHLFSWFDQNSICWTYDQKEQHLEVHQEIPRGCEVTYLRFILFKMNRHVFDVQSWFKGRDFQCREQWASNNQTGKTTVKGQRLCICDRSPIYPICIGAAPDDHRNTTLLPSVKPD